MSACQTKLEEDKERSFCQKIYEDNHLRMFHAAMGILKQQMDAENAVNDAFVSIMENRKRYSHMSVDKMASLCIVIVRNKCIDILRRKEHLSTKDIETLVPSQADEDLEPERYVMRREQDEIIHCMMERLPKKLQVVLEMKYYDGLSRYEMAGRLGVSVKAVDMRLYRAKQKMKKLLKDEDI